MHPIAVAGMTDKFGYFLTIVNVKEIPKAEINPYVAPRITEPSGAFSAASDPLTAREIPHTAKININHEIKFCCSLKNKTDNKAVKRGIVANAVNTTMTEVSLIPRVKLTELTAIATIISSPGIENVVRNSLLCPNFLEKNQMKKFNQFSEDADKVAALRARQKAAVAKYKTTNSTPSKPKA